MDKKAKLALVLLVVSLVVVSGCIGGEEEFDPDDPDLDDPIDPDDPMDPGIADEQANQGIFDALF